MLASWPAVTFARRSTGRQSLSQLSVRLRASGRCDGAMGGSVCPLHPEAGRGPGVHPPLIPRASVRIML